MKINQIVHLSESVAEGAKPANPSKNYQRLGGNGAHVTWLVTFRDGTTKKVWADSREHVSQRLSPEDNIRGFKATKIDEQGVAEGKVKLYTDPDYFGAEVDDAGFDSLPVVNISADRLVGFEPDSKMNQTKSQANVEKIVAGLKKGNKLPPLLVRKYKDGYQVLDGHHRFWAYKLLGTKNIPVRIVADKDIEEISKQGVAEGLDEAVGNGDSESGRIGTLTTEANPNQQLSKYNPNGKTYRGVQNKMPTLEPDPVDNAVRWGDDDTGSYEQNFGKEEMKRIIAKHLDLLDEKQKKVLKLRFWDGMTTQEVASVLNVTQSRITQIENKAMRVLKVKFYKSGITSDSIDIDEGWSQKYKSSINCSHPKGFSQKAHCAGKKKHNESIEMEMVCEDCGMCQTHGDHENLDEACWKGYHKEGNKKMFGKTYPNCVKNTNEEQEQHSDSCPHCGGELVSEELINEKKDACYYKVKSRYKVWPSAYASGALVKCRKKGAGSWGNGSKNEGSILEGIEQADESLHDWFNKEKWVRMDTKGNIKGPCAKEPGEGKPKCLPQAKAHSLGKKGRASAASRKRREDPNPERSGKAINVNTKKEKKITEMDKSNHNAGRDTGPRSGPEREAKPVTAKKATKDAENILTKSFKDSQRVDPRTGKKMIQKGVAENKLPKPYKKWAS